MDDSDTPPLLTKDVTTLQDALSLDAGEYQVRIPTDAIVGILRPYNRRAREVLICLLRGYSLGMAAANSGIHADTVTLWGKKHPEFADAVRKARDWGFRRTAERELQRRALAGSDDKHSGRLLELWLKREDSAYRDKSQLQMEVVHRAMEAGNAVIQGWQPDAPQIGDAS